MSATRLSESCVGWCWSVCPVEEELEDTDLVCVMMSTVFDITDRVWDHVEAGLCGSWNSCPELCCLLQC